MTLSLAAHVVLTDTDHGAVLLDQKLGRYWVLNDTAVEVARSMCAGHGPEGAAAALRARFPDRADQVSADVAAFVAALRDAGLVAS